MNRPACQIIGVILALTMIAATAAKPDAEIELRELDQATQNLKQEMLDLEAELTDLEQEISYPAPRRWTVFFTVDPAMTDFMLDAVELSVDGTVVTRHRYSDQERAALANQGAQKLFIAGLNPGPHRVRVRFEGQLDNQPYRREQRFTIDKPEGPRLLELRLSPEVTVDNAGRNNGGPGLLARSYDDLP
ncbi:hypothetical protein [Spectribacter hydrogenoxidans]|uniref:AraC family transcriptional regulator n=1 Tax=Spectribacter hydrogenoxidans TaxID=3075608 RepID=A0ABU3C0A1_9GAMM|nr:hypothetical protein [Salinisphaera sp. W335]MDT0634974.1 hypothetical protein [Salinisphaera sp. W335]